MPLLLALEAMHFLFGIMMFLTAVFLVLLVLVQRGRGGGLSGALGGAGGQSAFGAKAGDDFTKITMVVAGFWILLCASSIIILNSGKTGRFESGSGVSSDAGSQVGGTGDTGGAGAADGGGTSDQPADSPNIILIFIDDMGRERARLVFERTLSPSESSASILSRLPCQPLYFISGVV